MFQDILLLITLILALYGLAQVITFLALWLTASVKNQPYRVIVDLNKGENHRAVIINVRERLSMAGLLCSSQILVVDHGLSVTEAEQARAFCKGEQIPIIDVADLSKIIQNPSFQKENHTV